MFCNSRWLKRDYCADPTMQYFAPICKRQIPAFLVALKKINIGLGYIDNLGRQITFLSKRSSFVSTLTGGGVSFGFYKFEIKNAEVISLQNFYAINNQTSNK